MLRVMRVRVVEDFADTRALVSMILRAQGCEVVEASDGQEAVSFAQANGLDLILMDLNLPVLDGFAATRQILADPKTRHIPVVAMSAHCWEFDWREKARRAGCLDCLGKPINFEKLRGLLDRYAA